MSHSSSSGTGRVTECDEMVTDRSIGDGTKKRPIRMSERVHSIMRSCLRVSDRKAKKFDELNK